MEYSIGLLAVNVTVPVQILLSFLKGGRRLSDEVFYHEVSR
ncbi:MAG TPA: hypothetical protein VNA18_02105 [Nitrososphaeraceae archaeon]|nr:hypothetical protein [Nitrososphaeraceae archaeon]